MVGLFGDRFNMMVRASGISSDGFIDHSASDLKSAMVTGIWSAPADRIRFNIITGSEKTGISWWGVPSGVLPLNRRYNPAGEYEDSNGVLHYYDDETDVYSQNHYHLFHTHLFRGHVILNTGLHLTTGKGYYEEQKSDLDPSEYGLEGLMNSVPEVTSTDIVQRKWLDNIFYGAVWSLLKEGSHAEWTLGGARNRYDVISRQDNSGRVPGAVLPGQNGTGIWPQG